MTFIHKTRTASVAMLLAMAAFTASAQQTSTTAADEMADFRKGMFEEYNAFRKSILEEYDKFMTEAWISVGVTPPKRYYSQPKPSAAPTVGPSDLKSPQADGVEEFIPTPDRPVRVRATVEITMSTDGMGYAASGHKADAAQQREAAARAARPLTPTRKITSRPTEKDYLFVYNNTQMWVPNMRLPMRGKLKNIVELAGQWGSFKSAQAEALAGPLADLAVNYRLGTVETYEMICAMVNSRYRDAHASVRLALVNYLMNHLGYETRLAHDARSRTLILIPSEEKIFGHDIIPGKERSFYIFTERPDEQPALGNGQVMYCPRTKDDALTAYLASHSSPAARILAESSAKPETKSEPKTEPKAQAKAQPIAQVRPKAEPKPEVKAQPKPEVKPEPVVVKAEPVVVKPEPVAVAEADDYMPRPGEFEFDFHGTSLSIADGKPLKLAMKLTHEGTYRDHWANLRRYDTRELIESFKKMAARYNLNDFLLYDAVKAYAAARYPDAHESSRTSFVHFILVNLGLDARIGVEQETMRPLIMLPSKQELYSRSYLTEKGSGKKFYIFTDAADNAIYNPTYGIHVPPINPNANVGRTADFEVNDLHLPYSPHKFDIEFGAVHLTGEVNKNLMGVLYRYPQMVMEGFANSIVSPGLRESLVGQVKEQLGKLPERQAVDALLAFTQSGFKYETDDKFHGFEKPYFMEETLFYPYCDCEDRAIFYSYLLWNALGVENHLIKYPGHEATAVKLNQQLTSKDMQDYRSPSKYRFDEKTFYISDPTYIRAQTGQCMPDYRMTSPKIDKEYKQM